MDNKIRHLEMVQQIINRMSSNSFALKGWSVTLIAGIFALSSKDADKMYFLVAYCPIIVFWFLDSYYLLQERLFRALYEKVRNNSKDEVDFSMNIALQEFQTKENTYSSCLISKTELVFYMPLAILSTVIIIISHLP